MRKTWVVLLVLLLVGAGVFVAGCITDRPEDTVESFYLAIEEEDSERFEELLHEASPLQPEFIEVLGFLNVTVDEIEEITLEEVKQDTPLLDYFFDDPEEFEQYIDMALNETGLTEEDEEYAIVTATITIGNEEITVQHILIEQNDEWKIYI
ncbi:hypothetical protein [Methanonatronarchaeum sp. AMET-Sl]|uniref:hypothetical protein n=1 Tax=Methanonatronarchaeum sp. AMET-Sl TaxID=3037654 RepID=UPI00244DE906|nr:hypothetical protein [Methanonatronarchaeum sp. AMET-Sl]WGI18102.1 hypothetical protein QEN48_03620 [Methanonatronarchaeum sp. AMET-Sl]